MGVPRIRTNCRTLDLVRSRCESDINVTAEFAGLMTAPARKIGNLGGGPSCKSFDLQTLRRKLDQTVRLVCSMLPFDESGIRLGMGTCF